MVLRRSSFVLRVNSSVVLTAAAVMRCYDIYCRNMGGSFTAEVEIVRFV